MAPKRNIQPKTEERVRRTPELIGFNPVPATDIEYLDLVMHIKTDFKAFKRKVIPRLLQEKGGVLYLGDLEQAINTCVLPDGVLSRLSETYQQQKAQLEETLLDAFVNKLARIWLETDKRSETGLEYVVYADGRCMECFRKKRASQGWLRTRYTGRRIYETYEELRANIWDILVRDKRLEENEDTRQRYVPQCKNKSHLEPTLLTLGHRIITTIPPKDMVEARIKTGAGLAPKIVEFWLGEEETFVERHCIDDYLATRCRAQSPDVWRKLMILLRAWSPRRRFEGRINVKGYPREGENGIDTLISQAIGGDKGLYGFYRSRIEPNLNILEDSEARFVEVILPLEEYEGNPLTVHVYEDKAYTEMSDHREYNRQKEHRINELWSPLALLTLKRIMPVYVPSVLQGYAEEIRAPAFERFNGKPVHV